MKRDKIAILWRSDRDVFRIPDEAPAAIARLARNRLAHHSGGLPISSGELRSTGAEASGMSVHVS